MLDVADGDEHGEPGREVPPPDVVAGVVEPEALEHRPRAVEDVEPERELATM